MFYLQPKSFSGYLHNHHFNRQRRDFIFQDAAQPPPPASGVPAAPPAPGPHTLLFAHFAHFASWPFMPGCPLPPPSPGYFTHTAGRSLGKAPFSRPPCTPSGCPATSLSHSDASPLRTFPTLPWHAPLPRCQPPLRSGEAPCLPPASRKNYSVKSSRLSPETRL